MSPRKSSSKIPMGALRKLKIRCISETGWFDTPTLLSDVKTVAAHGPDVDQYDIPWPPFGDLHPENAAGSSALIETEGLDGGNHRFMLDSGWGPEWMDKRLADEGIDAMLRRGEVEFLVISHEHFDHFWGIGSTIMHCPDLPIYVPHGFRQEGFDLIARVGHRGTVTVVPPDQPIIPFPGLAIANFPMETLGQVHGENILYASIAQKGLAMMTGCGHGGILDLLDYGKRTFQGADKVYAVYGGLHISPFEEWDARRDRLVQALRNVGIEHLGCNHCTGEIAVRKMIDAGLPVVRGSARHGSRTDLYLGNGDVLELG